jgi:formylglycine-generating enzyme required for sulfatase activity
MRNFLIVSVVFLAASRAASSQTSKPVDPGKAPPGAGAGARTEAPSKELVVDLGAGAKLEMIRIPAGEFKMGSPGKTEIAEQHRVRISKPFYLGKYPVTQWQWFVVMDDNPSKFSMDKKRPVENVTWEDCQVYLRKLNATTRRQNDTFALPTEAQWEYACRAGSTTEFCFGDEASALREYAWYAANSDGKTHPVGEKKPNAWGLYDMHGNVNEWCQDWFDDRYYGKSPTDDPTGPETGSFRVVRGGGLTSSASSCGSAVRRCVEPAERGPSVGLRVALVPVDRKEKDLRGGEKVPSTKSR